MQGDPSVQARPLSAGPSDVDASASGEGAAGDDGKTAQTPPSFDASDAQSADYHYPKRWTDDADPENESEASVVTWKDDHEATLLWKEERLRGEQQ